MNTVRHISDFKPILDKRVGFVPTMGAFHDGHLALMRQARRECDIVVVSLFVNPTQFGDASDFSLYPRDESRDLAMAEREGVDVLFAPPQLEMYPRNSTSVHVSGVSERWEGEHRPGHFDGVATVVCKLFHIVQPHNAYFGLKDLQQCAVVRRMCEDLNLPVQLRFVETVREPDGLALSSRNVRLSPEERGVASKLHESLQDVADFALNRENGTAGTPTLSEFCAQMAHGLENIGFSVEYLVTVDPLSMSEALEYSPGCRVIAAARLGQVRLIDNVPVGAS